MSFTPKTRLEKILCGVAGAADNARTRLEKAVAEAVSNAGSGGNAPLDATMTMATSDDKTVITFDKTAAEMFAAAAAGKMVKGTGQINAGGSTATLTSVLPIEVFRMDSGGAALYTFKLRGDMNDTDKLFFGEGLTADAPVVLTEV